ncbi:hypothetical protein D3C78_1432640 [compost metagenome]
MTKQIMKQTRRRILNSAGPKQMLTKYVSFGNISGAHVPKTAYASEVVFYENV